jgi:UDP-N-acetylmuramoyl-tripeptide--D-alanyl-D-alanine ligase
MDLQQLSHILDLPSTAVAVSFDSLSIDTRTLQAGQCFLALRGEHFDGHDFVPAAKAGGAVAAIVEYSCETDIPQLVVPNAQQALASYARYNRLQFKPRVVAVTGSSGKTTVKEMLASILAQVGPTYATRGNFNNHIGVPLSLLELTAKHRYAVFECGASQAGDIAYTTDLIQPQICLINNVGQAHLSGFGSVDGIAAAKAEIYAALPADGIAVVNLDDAYAPTWLAQLAGKRVLTFSMTDPSADIHAENIVVAAQQPSHFSLCIGDQYTTITLSLAGLHNVRNALAAAALASACGCAPAAIAKGLRLMQAVAGRMQQREGHAGAVVYDDSYNANPGSAKAAIDALAQSDGQRILVLGDMGELGDDAIKLHAEVGHYAKVKGIDALYAVGPLSAHVCEAFGENAYWFSQQAELVRALVPALNSTATCVVKGSRSARMEVVVAAICHV